MNVGQILETHLGWAASILGFEAKTPVFQGASEDEIGLLLKVVGSGMGQERPGRPDAGPPPFEHRRDRSRWSGRPRASEGAPRGAQRNAERNGPERSGIGRSLDATGWAGS
jgi:hypothetical protein